MLNDGYEGLSFEVIVHLPIVIVPLKETETLNYCTFLVFLALSINRFYIVYCKFKNLHTHKSVLFFSLEVS